MHLGRAPNEPDRPDLREFYRALLGVLADPAVHDGSWELAPVLPAWDGNDSHNGIIAFSWISPDREIRFLVVVNLAETAAQGYVLLPGADLAGRVLTLDDRLSDARYEPTATTSTQAASISTSSRGATTCSR